jgi:hypothetical protein
VEEAVAADVDVDVDVAAALFSGKAVADGVVVFAVGLGFEPVCAVGREMDLVLEFELGSVSGFAAVRCVTDWGLGSGLGSVSGSAVGDCVLDWGLGWGLVS